MSNIILTSSGASFMNLAGPSGPYIPIKYFVPVYDHRYDTSVHPTSALIPISAGDFTSAVNPFGDIIWNIDSLSASSYSMSPEKFLIYDPNQSGTSTITNSSFNATSYVTLRTGRPLSHSISATSFVYNYPNWNVNGYTIIPSSSATPSGYSTTTQKFFNTVSYAPISSAAGGNSRGLFKVRLGNQVGNFKFNKIALYAAKYLANGAEDTSVAPVLFGIAMLKEPIIKSNDGFNISFFELDVELQFSSNGYFSNVSFLQNNEWNYVASKNSLWFDGSAILGSSAVPGSWSTNAKLHIVEPNVSVPLMRMTTDNSDYYVDDFLRNAGSAIIKTKTFSKPSFSQVYKTSGSSSYSSIQSYLGSQDFSRQFLLVNTDPISGTQQTGILTTYSGYVETTDFMVNTNVLARFKSSGPSGSYNSLVLGSDANTSFQDNVFLTVHGGATLIGLTSVSGTISANGNIISTGANLYIKDITSNGSITTNDIVCYDGVYAYNANQLSLFDRARFLVSADFQSPVTINDNLFINGTVYANAGINVTQLYATDIISSTVGIESYGFLQISKFDKIRLNVSADFQCPVTINGRTTISDGLSAYSVSAYNGYWEGGRSVAIGKWVQYFAGMTFSGTLPAGAQTSGTWYTFLPGETMMLNGYWTGQPSVAGNSMDFYLPIGYKIKNISNASFFGTGWYSDNSNGFLCLVSGEVNRTYVSVSIVNQTTGAVGANIPTSVTSTVRFQISFPWQSV
mgnify:CR=1 FL=1